MGKVFGRLTVTGSIGSLWKCSCTCGGSKLLLTGYLTRGDTRSCGCLHRELLSRDNHQKTHGAKYTTEYKIWDGMKQRCNNPRDKAYPAYGGRGIYICDRWLKSFENFLSDVGYRPNVNFTLDRVNNDGPYSPDNCRWATWDQQNNNQRTNRIIEFGGKSQNMSQWAREWGINYKTFKWYIHVGKSMEYIEKKRKI